MSHTVYRCYDADGLLLYVGCTSKLKARISEHQHAGPKATLASRVLAVCMAWVEVASTHEGRAEAIAAERREIGQGKPLLNIQGNNSTLGAVARTAAYLEAHGIAVESVGIWRCLYCEFLVPYRSAGYICQDCEDADFRAWIDERQRDGWAVA